jgi:hypothetical protein
LEKRIVFLDAFSNQYRWIIANRKLQLEKLQA